MGTIILKVDPDRDLYVEWSSVVESPTYIGTRAEFLAYLTHEIPDGYSPLPGNSPEDRLARADETGTSACYGTPPHFGAFDAGGFIVEQRGVLPRADLGRFVDALLAENETTAYELLQPFEDDETPGCES